MEELYVDWIDSGEAEGQQKRRERAGERLVLGGVLMSGIVLMQGRLFLGIVCRDLGVAEGRADDGLRIGRQ